MPVVVRKAAKLPAFIDVAPPPALRREHAIGQRHMTRFSRAFMRVSRSIYDPATLRDLDAILQQVIDGKATIEDAVNVVAWFNEADPLATKQWELLGRSVEVAYEEIVEDAGQGEIEAHGWPLSFVVTKAARKDKRTAKVRAAEAKLFKERLEQIQVPINPFSLAWVRAKAASLVVEISNQQKRLLREIIAEGFEAGERPETILKEIQQLVGLTRRERGWVQNRREALAAKLEGERLERAVDRYARRLLRQRANRIARTETIDAYAQGLDDSWQLAKDEGLLDDTVMQDWVELSASPRTCKICQGLGKSDPVPLGQPFVSEFIGEIYRPPSHPH